MVCKGLKNLDMAADKWNVNGRPYIDMAAFASEYLEFT